MKKSWNKRVALLLAVIMLFGMLPTNVFANTGESGGGEDLPTVEDVLPLPEENTPEESSDIPTETPPQEGVEEPPQTPEEDTPENPEGNTEEGTPENPQTNPEEGEPQETIEETLEEELLALGVELEEEEEVLGAVRVIIENTTFSTMEDAPWEGTLVDTSVDITASSTMMSCVKDALDNAGLPYDISETQYGLYIVSINNLAQKDNGTYSGWMGTLNDWFTDTGFGNYTVANGNLQSGDEIRIMYTSAGTGSDLGQSFEGGGKSLAAIAFSAGTLDKSFSPEEHEYTLTLPAGTGMLSVQPTAANKAFQVRVYKGESYDPNTGRWGKAHLGIADGDTVTVVCGDSAWPGPSSSEAAGVYTFHISISTPITVYVSVSDRGLIPAVNGRNMVNVPITVNAQGDGKATVDAVMQAFHAEWYPNGYETVEGEYGTSVTKLWGQNTGNTLFFIGQTALANGVAIDRVAEGAYVTASVNQDNQYYADWFTYFDRSTATVTAGEELTLSISGYQGMAWQPTAVPVAGLQIGTMQGGIFTPMEGVKTNENGQAVLRFAQSGTYLVSATGTVRDTVTTDWSTEATAEVDCPIIAPACIVTVEAEKPTNEGDDGNIHWALYASGLLEISPKAGGDGSMKDYSTSSSKKSPWAKSYAKKVKTVIVCAGVQNIGETAFYNCSNLTTIQLEEGLKSIGANAFKGCSSLEALQLPSTLESFESSAIKGLSALETLSVNNGGSFSAIDGCLIKGGELVTVLESRRVGSLTIPAGVSVIGEKALYQSAGLTAVVLPDGITEIKANAFGSDGKLASINLPEGLTTIGAGAFNGCKALSALNFPASLNSLAPDVLDGCTAMENYSVAAGGTFSAAEGCLVKDGTLLAIPAKKITGSFAIPNGITTVGEAVLKGNTTLTQLTLPEGVTTVMAEAFMNCSNLETLSLPASLSNLDETALNGCTKLKTITLAENDNFQLFDGVLYDGQKPLIVLEDASGVIHIPEGITQIPAQMFKGKTAITGVEFPSTLLNIGANAFEGTGLTSLIIPANVTQMGEEAFANCAKLESVIIADAAAIEGGEAENFFADCESLSSVTLPENLKELKDIFSYCSALTSIQLPEGLTAFGGLSGTGITEIKLPAGVTTLPTFAFDNCAELVRAELPGVVTVEEKAFMRAFALRELVLSDKLSTFSDSLSAMQAGSLVFFMGSQSQWESVNFSSDAQKILASGKIRIIFQYDPETPGTPPVILTQPQNASFVQNLRAAALTVELEESEGTEYIYYWYEKNTNSDLLVSNEAEFVPPVTAIGEKQYYCVIMGVTEGKVGSVTSDPATVTVTELGNPFAGSGTEEDPYQLADGAALNTLSALVENGSEYANKYYVLTNDVTLPAKWIPVGVGHAFAGNFDGKGYTLTVPAGEKPLFSALSGATVKNLKIYGTKIQGNGLVNSYGVDVPGFTLDGITLLSGTQTLGSGLMGGDGNNECTIRNCVVESGVVIGYEKNESRIGSIAGGFNGTIENCTSAATVYGVDSVGGIVGNKAQSMRNFVVSGCSFTGTVEATGKFVGGICGSGYAGGNGWAMESAPNAPGTVLTGNSVTGSVSGAQAVGGILGAEAGSVQMWDNGVGQIKNNTFSGAISGGAPMGGIVGYMHSLNAYTQFEGNSYGRNCGASGPLGATWIVDTSFANPTVVTSGYKFNTVPAFGEAFEASSGVLYIDTSKSPSGAPAVEGCSWKSDHNRTDDPLANNAAAIGTYIGYVPAERQLADIAFASNTAKMGRGEFVTMTPAFDPEQSEYTITVPSTYLRLAAMATAAEGTEGKITVEYTNASTNKEASLALTSGTGKNVANLIKSELTARDFSICVGGEKAYTFHIERQAAIKTLSVKNGDAELTLNPEFDSEKLAYTLGVPADAKLSVTANALADVSMSVNGTALPADTATSVSYTLENRKATLTLVAAHGNGPDTTYTLTLSEIPVKLEITQPPAKTEYELGETIDLSGIVVLATYSDGASVEIPVERLHAEPAVAEPGLTEISIQVDGMSVTQPVTVAGLRGSGTESDPYLVETAKDAMTLSKMVSMGEDMSGKFISLTADITLPADWAPIGDGAAKAFKGQLDGCNHTVTVPQGGLTLMGSMSGGAMLKNLNIYGTQIAGFGVVNTYTTNQTFTLENITLKSGTQTLLSGFVGGYGNDSVFIRNSTVESGVVIGYDKQQSQIGSFGGDFNGVIENCTSAATVYGVDFVGGIVGCKGQTMRTFEIKNNTFTGSVQASGKFVGGIAGGGYGGTQWGINSAANTPGTVLLGNSVTGSVSGAQAVGGILGAEAGAVQMWDNGIGQIKNNVFSGTVSGSAPIGGIVGYMHSLNKSTEFEGNSFIKGCGASSALGGVWLIDTNFAQPTQTAGWKIDTTSLAFTAIESVQYINTETSKDGCPAGVSKIGYNRTDDPLANNAVFVGTMLVPVEGITLSESTLFLNLLGQSTATLTAQIAPTDASNTTISWSSSNEDVATVADGVVTALSVGTAEITAMSAEGGFKAICTLTVSDETLTAYVTISEQGSIPTANGKIMAQIPVLVPVEEDGKATVDAALSAFHAEYCPGGYSDGSIFTNKLWGVSTYNLLFFVNDEGLQNGVLVDKISDGDRIMAAVMIDGEYWSDWFTAFDKSELTVPAKKEFTLNISGHMGMAYTPEQLVDVAAPALDLYLVSTTGMEIIPGKTSDESGNVTLSFAEPGTYVVTAQGFYEYSEDMDPAPIIPPVCIVTVTEEEVISFESNTSLNPSTTQFFLNGESVDATVDGKQVTLPMPENMEEGEKLLLVAVENNGNDADPHKNYPVGMKVFSIEAHGDEAQVKEVTELENLLQYGGSSIRFTDPSGIRVITGIPTNLKQTLIKQGYEGYKLEEYGTVVAWVSELGEQDLTLDLSCAKSNYAYKRGVSDPVYANTDGLTSFTNVLIFGDISEQEALDKCVGDLVLRPYIKLSNGNEEIVLYGGAVQRNIGYIAWQNRSAFTPGSDAYEYIWTIIHHVYGDTYDSEYIKK